VQSDEILKVVPARRPVDQTLHARRKTRGLDDVDTLLHCALIGHQLPQELAALGNVDIPHALTVSQ
jgi:hypothetical protein